MVNSKRVRKLNNVNRTKGAVVYWMYRDQRVNDNWALLYAIEQAQIRNTHVVVIFSLINKDEHLNARHSTFLLEGLKEVEHKLKSLNIPFLLVVGDPSETLIPFITDLNTACVVTEFSPLKEKQQWTKNLAQNLFFEVVEVDTHNIVPCWIASKKEEFNAFHLRNKLNPIIEEFLEPFPVTPMQNENPMKDHQIKWEAMHLVLKSSEDVAAVDWLKPGEQNALHLMHHFIDNNLGKYEEKRNDPLASAQSNLSTNLNYGHISSQRIAMELLKNYPDDANRRAFLEQLITRKELSDNFCYYNSNYDSFEGLQPWAKKTLNEHRNDEREFEYSLEEFEQGHTHDDLWNAAQIQLNETGQMHGYLRMFWAKKILEWSPNPETAIYIAVYLNDKYALDGRDPNGYAGIMWSIGGVHDRAWKERPVIGKIRILNTIGCKRKFDVYRYIQSVHQKNEYIHP
ncbi:MAG: deoxyribodipyrimidine photo-lyase [Bacteroidales bacterium]|nr:deoxyribodipyrimidine photo-lyase [Bacteroidales bacterium]